MNEIEKMYENAGIKPTKNWQSCLNCKLKTETRYDEWGEEYLTCKRLEMPDECFDAKEYYPLFTAEKQIELIKWLADTDNYIKEICRMIDTRRYCIETIYKNISMANNFEEALAGLINNLWQDLTEEEKQQISEILE